MTTGQTALVAATGVVSWGGTWVVRRYALAHDLVDVPNARSSHVHTTPRGGGLAIAAAVIAALAVAGSLDWIPSRAAIALVAGGTIVALVGFIDDHGGVRPHLRLAVHFAAALGALWFLGGYPAIGLGATELHLGAVGILVAAVGIVWCTNFFNFMDGIDGIAAAQAVVTGLAGAWLLTPTSRGLGFGSGIVAVAAAGFLVWNWPPARIFMGDVGSGVLGFFFATLAVASENAGGPPVAAWGLLLGVFVFDATITLIRRRLRGQSLAVAHRLHAYQRAVQFGFSHRAVTSTVLGLDLVLVLLAWAGVTHPPLLLWTIGVGLVILSVCYWLIERRAPMPPMNTPGSPIEGGRR